MKKAVLIVYGFASYAVFFCSFLYSIGFLTNLVVPKSIDSGEPGSWLKGTVINTLLISLFALQHSIMARAGFKQRLTRLVPEAIERSTYVLLSGLVFFVIFRLWRPMPGTIWNIEGQVGSFIVTTLFLTGLAFVVIGSFLVNHFDLFGLRQVYLHLQGREYSPIAFKTPALYKVVRHPIMLGYLIAFWSTPHMTIGHFIFASAMTAYIIVGLWFEERDLVAAIGQEYQEYQQRVPMLLPSPKNNA